MNRFVTSFGVHSIWLSLAVSSVSSCWPNRALAASSCRALYVGDLAGLSPLEKALRAENFAKMFLRFTAGEVDATYLANMIRLARAFEARLLDKAPLADFTEFLREQHRMAILGQEPGTFYWPETNYRHDGYAIPANIVPAQSYAGRYRSEVGAPSDKYLHHEVLVAAEIREKILALTNNQTIKATSVGGVPFRFKHPQVEGIPEEAGPRYSISGDKIQFDYPAPKYIRLYLAEMAKSLEFIHQQLQSGAPDRELVLKALARYYHLVAVGHPFLRVNNSLVMAEVNVVLLQIGMNTVPHGDLDYLMRSLDSADAEQVFVAYILQNQ